jgi:catechol 2,3-dioxygenase-like lactoylglutathione lyase family enzyme
MERASIPGISPCFIVQDVPATLAFYRDRLGFDITYEGPEPDDIFFGIVRRDGAQILFKEIGVPAVPNRTRDFGQGLVAWDAFVIVPDPDTLAAEYAERGVPFDLPLGDTHDGLRGFAVADPDGYVLFFGRPR